MLYLEPHQAMSARAKRALRYAATTLISQACLIGAAHAVPVIDSASALIFGNFTSTTHASQGALLVGGNTTLTGYGVNGQSGSSYGIISGGTVNLTNSAVTGGIWSGGSVNQSGSVVSGSLNTLGSGEVPWDLYRSYYSNLSTQQGKLANTGTSTLQWGTLNLTATSAAQTAVFTVTADQLRGASTMSFSGLAAGQNLVINVLGSNVSFSNMDLASSLGAYSSTLNFVDATSINFNSLDLSASILAAGAKITGQNGNINGMVVAKEWDSQLALKYNAQTALKLKSEADMRAALGQSPINKVPEPGSLALTGVALIGLALARRRAQARRNKQVAASAVMPAMAA